VSRNSRTIRHKKCSKFRQIRVGLSKGNIPDGYYLGPKGSDLGDFPNSYAIPYGCDHCFISGKKHPFEWPNRAIKPKWDGQGDVVGCGILISSKNQMSIFFTGNGILMGQSPLFN
jgi:hypothetical protein